LPALSLGDNGNVMPLPSVLDEIDRLFDELVRRPWGMGARQVVPAEVREVKDGWVVKLLVEGLTAADLQVHVQGDRLTVSGHRHRARERRGETGWTQTQQEIAIHRTIALPAGADPDSIDAKIEDSTLTIHIRRRQP
jgi:HSP20 family protein